MEVAATIAALASALIAGLALAGWYLDRRVQQLRKSEVLVWANEAIAAMQSIYLVCALDVRDFRDGMLDEKMDALVFETSILVERGRLFFRNVVIDDFGNDKAEAYRGYRPRILDHLVVGHQIACAWRGADVTERRKMAILAEDRVKKFVSMVRGEVGRDKTASDGAAERGDGIHLEWLLSQIDLQSFVSRNRL